MIIPAGRAKYVTENYEYWSKFGKKKKFFRYGVLEFFLKAPRHKYVHNAVMMPSTILQSVFGKQHYNSRVSTIAYIADRNSKIGDCTMAWQVHDDLYDLYHGYKFNPDQPNGLLESKTGNPIKEFPTLTVKSKCKRDKKNKPKNDVNGLKGNDKFSTIQFDDNLLRINYGDLRSIIYYLESALEFNYPDIYNSRFMPDKFKSLEEIKVLLKELNGIKEYCIEVHQLTGEYAIPIYYEEGISGRLYDTTPTMQRLSRESRKALLKTWSEYDIENTNPTILVSLFEYYKKYATEWNSLGESVEIP